MKGVKVPIACSLTADAASVRIQEWRTVLSTSVTTVTRPVPGRVELRMVDDLGSAGTLIDLARREKACCEFFTFTIEIDALGATLVIEVPDDAVLVLDDFGALSPAATDHP